MNWLKKLLGIDTILDLISDLRSENTDISEYTTDVTNKIEDEIAVLRDMQIVAAENATEQIDKIKLDIAELPNIDELFAVGICKLKKDEVYIMHVGDKVHIEEIDALQRQMTKYGIKCVIVASERMVVLNL